MSKGYLQTGQLTCHDQAGRPVDCAGSGQDAEFKKGLPWPSQRFVSTADIVKDRLTGLSWTKNANLTEFPVTWQEALDVISEMNLQNRFNHSDWRLPNRRELRSLIDHQTRKPALPPKHAFANIFQGWYWTSTSAAINPAYAWYIHLEGARMFYGNKKQYCFLWPVRGGGSDIIPATGQKQCYDSRGNRIACTDSGQDGELVRGTAWPEPRFEEIDTRVIDRLTDLCWTRKADLTGRQVTWDEALAAVARLNAGAAEKLHWRLPNINELETLVDCSMHSPALPAGHPFQETRETYWSSTTSIFEPTWAWALYLHKGAVGVGHKKGPHFHVWPVSDGSLCLPTFPSLV